MKSIQQLAVKNPMVLHDISLYHSL